MNAVHTPLRDFFHELEMQEWDYLTANEIKPSEKRGWLPQEISEIAQIIRDTWARETGGETY